MVKVNKVAYIKKGILTGYIGKVIGYDSINEMVEIRISESEPTIIIVTQDMIEQE